MIMRAKWASRARALLVVAATAALAACQQTAAGGGYGPQANATPELGPFTEYQVGSVNERGDCNIDVWALWRDTDIGRYRVEARSRGESCDDVEISVAIRAPSRAVIMRLTFEGAQVAGFSDVVETRWMRSALINWITDGGRSNRDTNVLPPVDQLSRSRLTLARTMTPEAYEALREARRPLICFTNTLETKRCFALSEDGGRMTPIGDVSIGSGS